MVENQQNLDNKEANKDNIEDYSVVAQRFLNIFRQLHVFTPERKKAFDDMILAQPPEVRSMFGKLIGGNLLQEYVDELEKTSGITASRDTSIASNKMAKLEAVDSKAEQILAKALETTQKTSQVSNQAQMQQLQLQAQLLEAVKNIPMQSANPIDPKNLEDIVASIMKSQTELITNVTKAQTEQLSKLIAASLQESYRHSTQSILETIKIMNKDSLEVLRENFKLYANNNTPIILSNYNVSNPSGLPQASTGKISENDKTQEIVYEKAPAEFYYEEKKETPVEEAVKEDEVISESESKTDTVIQEENTAKKKKKKKKNKNKNINNEQLQEQNTVRSAPAPILDYSLFDSDDNDIIEEKEETSADKNEDILGNLNDEDIMSFTSDDIDISDLGNVTPLESEKELTDKADKKPKKEEKKSEDKKNTEKKESNFIANISKFIKNAKEEEKNQKAELKASDNQTAPKEVSPRVEYSEEKEHRSDEISDEAWEWVEEDNAPQDTSSNEEWEWVEEEVEQPSIQTKDNEKDEDEGEWEWVEEEDSTPQEASSNEKLTKEENKPLIIQDDANEEDEDEGEWEWVEEETEQPSIKTEDNEEDEDEGEWEWVEEEDSTPQEASSDEEWEWVEEDNTAEQIETTEVGAAEEDKTINDQDKSKENWEWEYEEIPEENVSLVDKEPVTFEEEYIEPEGEEHKKPAPISSDGIIDQESIFKFDDDNYVDIYKQDEDIVILPPSVPDPIQNNKAASVKEHDNSEPEDYWRLEEPENEELMIIDSNYDDLNINNNEDDLIEGLETVDNSIFKDEDENIDNLYVVAK